MSMLIKILLFSLELPMKPYRLHFNKKFILSLMMSGSRCQSSTGEHEAVEGRIRENDSHNKSSHEDHTADSYGSTSRLPGNRKQIIFDKYGRPCDIGSEQFVTKIGKIVGAHCHPAIDSWTVVSESIKDDIWNNVAVKYEVTEIYKPNIPTKANVSWRNWKHQLRRVLDKYDTIAEMKRNMLERLIAKREDWESFVDFFNTDEDKKRRAAGKNAREAVELLQSCGKKGISRTIYDLEKESPTGEINRCVVFATTHVTKTINDQMHPHPPLMLKIRKIKELVDADPKGQNDIDNDAIAKSCGRDQKGHVRGMGGGVTKTQMRASALSRETLRKV
ncbi:uncharacterized protein LOC113334514 isoform X2 [Papaver somniferum]|uniref:uncharacterized protein LOC113334514 isoform X2 n=1 Tax=Papaver somniferum TaxID=3469 RepID=UPI000E7008E9|nr:uncharacterized protein LOC113334514 isoform X2 [Papaver somniferum]XP_026436532.1 uncharacterized protein LOC113334514 isoform X2 [Papaver somniferum]XP_026436533.1 uncharacterized protein LOC113334514 isoform X2 [Papaver somniferum]